MSLKSGLAGQIGYKTETTYGTAVTVDRFVPLVSESVGRTIDRLEMEGQIAGRRILDSDQWVAGNDTVAGSIQHEVTDNVIGLLLEHAFGTNNTTGSGPYTHTMTPGDLDGKSFTAQVGRPGIDGTVRPFTWAGCKVTSWELAGAIGEIATLGLDIVAQSETTATALASASYATNATPMRFIDGSLTLAGSPPLVVKGFSVAGDNGLAVDRRDIGAATIVEPQEADLRTYDGTITVEFEDLTQYAVYTGATEIALVLALTNGANSLTITENVRFDGANPELAGRGILEQEIPFKAIGDGSDADAITAVLVNNDSTA